MFMLWVWILWSKKKNYYYFQKENGHTFTLLIIFIVKSLQKEQNTGTPPLTRFFGPGKNRVKGKPRYRRSILVLKPKNGEYVSSKSTFLKISQVYSPSISFFCVPTNELIVVKYISIFENNTFREQKQKKGLKKAWKLFVSLAVYQLGTLK